MIQSRHRERQSESSIAKTIVQPAPQTSPAVLTASAQRLSLARHNPKGFQTIAGGRTTSGNVSIIPAPRRWCQKTASFPAPACTPRCGVTLHNARSRQITVDNANFGSSAPFAPLCTRLHYFAVILNARDPAGSRRLTKTE